MSLDDLLPTIDLSPLKLPPRSKLFSLEPIELGTARVEGLLSYLVRLARSHAVNPRHLVSRVFSEAEPEVAKFAYGRFFSKFAGTINGLGTYAEALTTAISKLTLNKTIHQMTLVPLRNIFPVNGTGILTKKLKWCPACIADASTAYRPLIWSFELYRYCPEHKVALQDACPSCGCEQPFIPNYPSLARCAYCKNPLTSRIKQSKPTDIDKWTSSALADLILCMPNITEHSKENLLKHLQQAAKIHTGGSESLLCKEVGLNRWAINGWKNKGESPSLPQFLTFTYSLNAMPSEMLGGFKVSKKSLRKLPRTLIKRDAGPLLNIVERKRVEAKLEKIIADENNSDPIVAVAKQLSLRSTCLKYWFPKQYQTIQKRSARFRKSRVEKKHASDRQVVIDATTELRKKGMYPSRRKMNRILQKNKISLTRKDLLEVYRAELGK